jgi:tetratricopeptide (TPR) repeat protein
MINRARHSPPMTIQVPPPGLTADSNSTAPEARPQPSFGDPFANIAAATPALPAPKPVLPAPTLPPVPAATPVAVATPVPLPTPVQVAMLPKPTPVPESQVTMPESRVDGLIAEARALRQRGDTSTAITRLREALAISAKNTVAMTELASTYEKMGLQDKAMEQWRAIYDLGDSAGIYYELADAKLKALQIPPPSAVESPGADNGSGAPAPDANGFQPGSSLALVNLSTVERPATPEGYQRFTLKIPVKRRADTKINVGGVVVQVFFYDQLGDDSIVRTNSNVAYHWATLPADWQHDEIEILDVDYTQAPPEPGKIEEARHYYGYIVCVYYNKELQDQAADPLALLKKNPPPLTLPEK